MRATFFTPVSKRRGRRALGLLVVALTIVLPALPLGPLAAPPWVPIGAFWAAYGWASEAAEAEKIRRWDGVRAPLALAAFGLLHDQVAGGPMGWHVMLYLVAFLLGRIAASTVRTVSLGPLWAGFIATCAALTAFAAFVGPWAVQGALGVTQFGITCAITGALFPLVRSLFMDTDTA